MRTAVLFLAVTFSALTYGMDVDRRTFCSAPLLAAAPILTPIPAPTIQTWKLTRVSCSDPERKRRGLMDITAALEKILGSSVDSEAIRWKLWDRIQQALIKGQAGQITERFEVAVPLSDGRTLHLRPLLRVKHTPQIVYKNKLQEAWVIKIEVVNGLLPYAL